MLPVEITIVLFLGNTPMAHTHYQASDYRPKILLVAIQAPYNKTGYLQSYYEEFVNLVRSNGLQYDDIMYIKLRTIDAGTFITEGHLDAIKKVCDEKNIDEVVISEPLSPQQERNLADYLHCRIFDRTELILEIFEKAAHSAEAKAQINIASLEYRKSRLSGKGIHLSQQSGVMGIRGGFGETAKEKERRHIEEHILKLKKHLEQLHKTRETQRKQRLKSNIPLFCLVGYTNTGKSTILNMLTKSNVLAEDKLFATLDTTTRELFINSVKKGLISDTVGFIQQLPHHLIEAFKSTLSELQYANLLLHVVDISDPTWQQQITIVHTILHDLDVDKKILYVFNKIDKVTMTPQVQEALMQYQPHVVISALTAQGLQPLIDYLDTWKPE